MGPISCLVVGDWSFGLFFLCDWFLTLVWSILSCWWWSRWLMAKDLKDRRPGASGPSFSYTSSVAW